MSDMKAMHVLVTRPDPAGSELCMRIREQGDLATHFPTIAFAEVADSVVFKDAIEKAGIQDWLIFISPKAVTASVPSLRARWPQLPPNTQFAAVGAGTAKALKAAGYVAAVVPETDWSTEGLMATPAFSAIQGKRVAIVRGEGGRELLEVMLKQRGALVSHIVAYRRELPAVTAAAKRALLAQLPLDVILCGSYEAVNNLKILLGAEGWPLIKNTPVVVMSERIKNLARDLGFQTIWVTRDLITGIEHVRSNKK